MFWKKVELKKNIPKISYSQCGEDLIIKYIFDLRKIKNPSYLDIGAYHPYHLSNTALFYKLGSRGINIEPNPALFENFKKFRADDVNLNIGVGSQLEVLDFFLMRDDTLSTFSVAEYHNLIRYGKEVDSVIKVNLLPINDVISIYNQKSPLDFISIDVEGFEYDILSSLDFNLFSPKVFCIEIAEYSQNGTGERRNDVLDFLKSKGYYEYACTNLNSILVNEKFWFD